jgi:transposase
LVTKLIKIESFKVTNYHFITDDEIVIDLSNRSREAKCPHCESLTNKVHQNHWYRIRDIPMSGYQVFQPLISS